MFDDGGTRGYPVLRFWFAKSVEVFWANDANQRMCVLPFGRISEVLSEDVGTHARGDAITQVDVLRGHEMMSQREMHALCPCQVP